MNTIRQPIRNRRSHFLYENAARIGQLEGRHADLLAALEEIAELPSVREDEASVIARAAINKDKEC